MAILGRMIKTEDDRTPLQKLRVWDLRKLAVQRGFKERYGIDTDNMTKDELLEVLGVLRFEPKTKPLSSTGQVSYDKWASYGIRLKARELGLDAGPDVPDEELIRQIEELETAPAKPLVAKGEETPAQHSVEMLVQRDPKGMKIWELRKLAAHMGIPWQSTWKGKDYISAINEKRAEHESAALDKLMAHGDDVSASG